MSKLLDPKTNISDFIAEVCRKHDVSVSELCRRAGIRRMMLDEWKNKEPKSIENLKKIMVELDKITNSVEVDEKLCPKENEKCTFECIEDQCKLID